MTPHSFSLSSARPAADAASDHPLETFFEGRKRTEVAPRLAVNTRRRASGKKGKRSTPEGERSTHEGERGKSVGSPAA
jgi:hypothetical protein